MNTRINFSGLSFEIGQSHRGLCHSALKARSYFSMLKNIGIEVSDCGDIVYEISRDVAKFFSESDVKKFNWTQFQEAYSKTLNLLETDIPLLNWGGDHSVAVASVGAFTTLYPDGYVIWIDAHADLNLPHKSLSGNFHGMPLSVLFNLEDIARYQFKWLKNYLDPSKLIYLGVRDLDPFETEMVANLGITTFTMSEIKDRGLNAILDEITKKVSQSPLHISFDIDSVDPLHAPSTGVAVKRGFNPNDLELIGKKMSGLKNLKSIDIVEINPNIGNQIEVDLTYITAFNFLRSIFTQIDQGEHDESLGERFKTEYYATLEWGL